MHQFLATSPKGRYMIKTNVYEVKNNGGIDRWIFYEIFFLFVSVFQQEQQGSSKEN